MTLQPTPGSCDNHNEMFRDSQGGPRMQTVKVLAEQRCSIGSIVTGEALPAFLPVLICLNVHLVTEIITRRVQCLL
jgi:hypothetical protein